MRKSAYWCCYDCSSGLCLLRGLVQIFTICLSLPCADIKLRHRRLALKNAAKICRAQLQVRFFLIVCQHKLENFGPVPRKKQPPWFSCVVALVKLIASCSGVGDVVWSCVVCLLSPGTPDGVESENKEAGTPLNTASQPQPTPRFSAAGGR